VQQRSANPRDAFERKTSQFDQQPAKEPPPPPRYDLKSLPTQYEKKIYINHFWGVPLLPQPLVWSIADVQDRGSALGLRVKDVSSFISHHYLKLAHSACHVKQQQDLTFCQSFWFPTSALMAPSFFLLDEDPTGIVYFLLSSIRKTDLFNLFQCHQQLRRYVGADFCHHIFPILSVAVVVVVEVLCY